MENATKALIIGAGMLFAVVILSFAVIAYNNLSDFYQSKQSNITTEQMAEINSEFGAYDRELTGFEVVSLINKCINFNEHHKTDDGYSMMTISVTIKNDPSYNNRGGLFTGMYGTPIVYNQTNNGNRYKLKDIIKNMQSLETKYKSENLAKLVKNENYNKLTEYGGDGSKTIEDVIGYKITKLPSEEELKKYSDYLVFKRSTFKPVDGKTREDKYNKYGQICNFYFEQK